MERIKRLNNWQKGILLLMAAIMLVFVGIYMMPISRVGFEYQDKIFVRSKEEGSTVYSGKLQGEQAEFIVSEDQTVVFRCGDKVYGPYTKTEDADRAEPSDWEIAGRYISWITVLILGGFILFVGLS